MATFKYFAYGSNMLVERLTAATRCPSATVIGVARVDGFELKVLKPSQDESGKAGIYRKAGESVYGVLFAIDDKEIPALDKAEGGKGYARLDEGQFTVELLADSAKHEATTYLATARNEKLHPYDWYKALMIAGAEQHDLPEDYVKHTLRAVPHIADPDKHRKTYLDALDALRKAGIEDYTKLL